MLMHSWIFLETDTQLVTRVAIYSMFPFIIAFAFIVFIFYRQTRETKLKRERLSLELTALRAQMNPHFIFNCLNAVYNEIQAQRNEEASRYLLKFTKLTRRVLENSGNKWITLTEDVNMLRSYIELEQFRLRDAFQFTIKVEDALDTESIEVPMMLIQPLLENIIWHRFSETGDHKIEVNISRRGNYLCYQIRDNGVIRDKTRATYENTGKKKSLGRQLVIDQLEAIAQITRSHPKLNEFSDESKKYQFIELTLPYSQIL